MAFKKSLVSLVLALPLVLGTKIIFGKNVDVLTMISLAAFPSKRSTAGACDFLEPIKTDLLENLFDNECGDTVGFLSPCYEHLSKDRKGSWCTASLFPWRHRDFSNLGVIIFKYWHLFISPLIPGGKNQRWRSWWVNHYFQCNWASRPRKRWNRWCSRRD